MQDLILSFRQLRRSPGFAAAAIITLALGIGANTAVFTAVNSILFRSMDVEQPNELVTLNRLARTELPTHSYPNYRDLRDRNGVFTGLVAYTFAGVSLAQGNESKMMWGYLVSGNYFDVLGAKPLLGRLLHPSDDVKKGAHPEIVISYACWQSRMGADPNAIGKTLRINGHDFTIAGVASAKFYGTERIYTPEFWTTFAMQNVIDPPDDWLEQRGNGNIFLLGRLKPGVTRERAAAGLNVVAAGLAREYPQFNEGMKITLSPPGLAGAYLRGPAMGFAAVLMVVATLVLLIACVNLASLLLARAADRRKEMAVRLALGAQRMRLVRQLLTESMVLSITGGAAGMLLAMWIADLLAKWRPGGDLPVLPAPTIDGRVLLFNAVVAIGTGIAFGLAPALQASRTSLTPALKNDVRSGRFRRWHARDFLVAAQVALSVVLVVGSLLVVRGLNQALDAKLGFEPKHAASAGFDLSIQGYSNPQGKVFQRQLLEKVRAIPGVESAGLATSLPLTFHFNSRRFDLEGQPQQPASQRPDAVTYRITAGYFSAAGARLIAGRDFDEHDTPNNKPVMIVNQAFAREWLHNENPLGKRIRYGADQSWIEIVGVVADGKYRALAEGPTPVIFGNAIQDYASSVTIVARASALSEAELSRRLTASILEMDPHVALYSPGPLAEQLGLALLPARVAAVVLGAFGILAVALATTGVNGIMAYAVARRSREIGIRMALGAQASDVVRSVLGRAGALLGAGSLAGLALALAANKMFAVVVYGVSTKDPLTYALALGMMAVVAFAASWFPARRAIAVDPVIVLRSE